MKSTLALAGCRSGRSMRMIGRRYGFCKRLIGIQIGIQVACSAEVRLMTLKQTHTLWHLRRQGLQFEAERAERAWSRGREFFPEQHAPLKRETRELIEQCNWELDARITQVAQVA